MTKEKVRFFALLIGAIFGVIQLAWVALPSFFEIWELQSKDQIIRLAYEWRGKDKVSPYVVHIDLDDQTIIANKHGKEGGSSLISRTIDILAESGVKTILMDLMIMEAPDSTVQHNIYKSSDRAGTIFFPLIISLGDEWSFFSSSSPALPKKSTWDIAVDNSKLLPSGHLALTNFEALTNAAAGHGHISVLPDRDGSFRRIPALISADKHWVPALALQAVSHYLDISPEVIRIELGKEIVLPDASLPDGQRKDIHIPIDEHGMIPITFSGPWNDGMPHISINRLLTIAESDDGLNLLMDELEGTIVVVSDISTSSRDFGPVTFSSFYPLSGLHANLINSILEQNFVHDIDFKWQLLLDLVFVLLLLGAACYGGKKWFIGFSVLILAAIFVSSMVLYLYFRILINPIQPTLSVVVVIPVILLCHFLEEQKSKLYIRARMSNYFAPSLLNKILKNHKEFGTVEKKELTILFSDIAGFTAWSSRTEATEIHHTLNEYFEEMAKIVFKYEGTIDKYMGDGLMVFFGDPVYNEDHPLLAVNAAREMQEKTRELRERWEPAGRLPVHIRIGINTGEVVVGNMGSSSRMDYTVIGSNVNLAQRLESNSELDGILVTDRVRELLKGRVQITSVGSIQAKGFAEPISVFSVDL